ncbi:MAG: carboxypeptidase regulatory-like domain-containing protein [Pirellulales bacterium]|nr:carboxypeptidase regulatory-like domain-containing protein [Pirellulales bacterium]
MKITRIIRLSVVSMAATGFMIPQSILAAAPTACPTKPVTPAIQANNTFFAIPTASSASATETKPVKQPSVAAKPKNKSLMRDVALQKDGVLNGKLVDPNGKPISKAKVSLLQNNRHLASTVTGKHGEFTFKGLRGGVYQVVTSDSDHLYRLWAPGTAPKSSGQIAQIVSGQPILRGQHTVAKVGQWLTSPLGLTAAAATAVAVPVALHNSDRDPSE